MQFDPARRELTLKIVYYGPALSGKTTNLQMLHRLINPEARGRLMSLDTADDRTLFFDLLPVFFNTSDGLRIRVKIYTVPGQVMHEATRRIVLAGADAVAFVADSQLSEARANADAWNAMMDSLRDNGLDPASTPIVLQFNKRDMPHIRGDDELAALRTVSPQPVFAATAIRGDGVLETLFALLQAAFREASARGGFAATGSLSEHDFLRTFFRHIAPARAEHLLGVLEGNATSVTREPA